MRRLQRHLGLFFCALGMRLLQRWAVQQPALAPPPRLFPPIILDAAQPMNFTDQHHEYQVMAFACLGPLAPMRCGQRARA